MTTPTTTPAVPGALAPPTPQEIQAALAFIDAVEVEPGLWHGHTPSGYRISVRDPHIHQQAPTSTRDPLSPAAIAARTDGVGPAESCQILATLAARRMEQRADDTAGW